MTEFWFRGDSFCDFCADEEKKFLGVFFSVSCGDVSPCLFSLFLFLFLFFSFLFSLVGVFLTRLFFWITTCPFHPIRLGMEGCSLVPFGHFLSTFHTRTTKTLTFFSLRLLVPMGLCAPARWTLERNIPCPLGSYLPPSFVRPYCDATTLFSVDSLRERRTPSSLYRGWIVREVLGRSRLLLLKLYY